MKLYKLSAGIEMQQINGRKHTMDTGVC
jgi:hypothetical protein